MGRSPAVVVLLHPRLDLLHGVRPVLHELGLHEAARGALGLGIHHGSSSLLEYRQDGASDGAGVSRWGFLLERTVGSVRRVALWDVHHSGEDSGLGSESRSPGCTPLLDRTVGSVPKVAFRDVRRSVG